jgi:hypothetical protein
MNGFERFLRFKHQPELLRILKFSVRHRSYDFDSKLACVYAESCIAWERKLTGHICQGSFSSRRNTPRRAAHDALHIRYLLDLAEREVHRNTNDERFRFSDPLLPMSSA